MSESHGPRRRRPRLPRRVRVVLALLCAAGALLGVVSSGSHAGAPRRDPGATELAQAGGPGPGTVIVQPGSKVSRGRLLFAEGCQTCHGLGAQGIPHRGPSLRNVGAAAADFELSTGRMPLAHPGSQPLRGKPTYSRSDIDALVAYIGSLGGPPVPKVDISKGDIGEGFQIFRDSCAGCHQVVGRGGMVTGARIPSLEDATPAQVGEAIRFGPFMMPVFSERNISPSQVNSLAKYVVYTRHPADDGGWGIGHIGPVPEGMVTLFLGLGALILTTRLIGERTTA